jgi:oligoribonuclease
VRKLLWIDMEMTGLDPTCQVILEVAALVTDLDLNERGGYEAVLKQPQKYLDAMDEWNTKHHGESGLTARVAQGKEPALVEDELIRFVGEHFNERAVIAGNSIHQDRSFIDLHMPRLADKLHYRMLDVTSWKILMTTRFGLRYEKKKAHRAQDDIRESLGELRYYLQHVVVPPTQ